MNWKEFLRLTQFKFLIFTILLLSGVVLFFYVINLTKTPTQNVTVDTFASLIFSGLLLLILDWPIPLFSITHTSSILILIPIFIVMGTYWYLLSSSIVWLYENRMTPTKKKSKTEKSLKKPNWLTIICVIGWIEAIIEISLLKIISIALIVTIYWLWKLNKRGWLWTIVLESIAILYVAAFGFPPELSLQYSVNVILPLIMSIVVVITLLIKKDFFKKKK